MMKYDLGTGDLENWIVAESDFKTKYQGKCEAIFCLGNGYLGMRAATEETYVGQVRDLFVAGTFNKCNGNEVTELPNAADMCGLDIFIDDDLFNLEKGTFQNYIRTLNLKNGEMVRSFQWTNTAGKEFEFEFRRFVSMADQHLILTSVNIKALNNSARIMVKSGINGQVTNTGAQHFVEGEKRIFDQEYLQMLQKTNQSGITFVQNTFHDFKETVSDVHSRFEMDRRKVSMIYSAEVEAGSSLSFTKYSTIHTTRDANAPELDDLRTASVETLKIQSAKGYKALLDESAAAWEGYWDQMDIHIESEDDFNQLAIRFAQYHLLVMTPKHDHRFGIGAKGLSGEGYKGHSFWDTEIFILPFFIYTFPDIARSLLEYRYVTIKGARDKAKDNGYRGAMYPWESAWADDGEVTPVWGAADIITGKATKIWSGFIEQHISSDVAFAIWQYYQITGDMDFMLKYGFEMLLDIGVFWSSRLEWNEEKQEYHINDVVGPDEYKEHVNNDAFTNHTAAWCMENALEYYELLKSDYPEKFSELNERLNLDTEIPEVRNRLGKIYIPQPNKENVVPQDDTYLSKKIIDMTKYKNQEHVGSLFLDYNLEQVNEMQVCKQASVVMLMYLLEHKFSSEVKNANYNYYEPKTTHDSSLSLSTHAVLAADVDRLELAYSLFEKAARIDLGPNMKTSDHGIHAASLGGIWQIIICGFAGLRMVNGKLRINPRFPGPVKSIEFKINWKGNLLSFRVDNEKIVVENKGNSPVDFTVYDKAITLKDKLEINYQNISEEAL